MSARRIRLAGLDLGLTDIVTLGGLVAFTLLTVVFSGRIERPVAAVAADLFWIAIYLGALALLRRLRRPWLRFLVRTGSVQLAFLQVYSAACRVQLLFFPWQDDRVLAWERALYDVQPLVAVQKLYTPVLNEWMFFVYVFYIVIYPSLGALIFFKRGEDANEDYLYQLGLVNLACSVGFVLFPVASPMHWEKIRTQLTEPLTARLFGSIGEWIRSDVHTPGGSVPSPHCAVATVMWFMSRKYTRRGALWLAPIILSLYVSTVYLRFHYVADAVIGVAAGLLVIAVAPALERAWDRTPAGAPGGTP
ncbi:MAG TPA: phosphatase PAP2 family protein [Candidatus Aminicenantes bacterium]|nr:phosphatase PAP2 family protein [Candidatus Aminicenantes bacterium]HRY65661.1 phosphatase PAP2 family protein [Candidatus Aminicenantes bacterium]HRZ72451.1 phosphatase PAP2 family protein [Candidatus Aminicenantes bacterium]